MTKVHLHKIKRPVQNKPKRLVWQLRWLSTDGKRYGEIIGEVGRMTKREAEYICREKQGGIDSGQIRRDRPKRITLASFLDHDRQAVQGDVKASTLVEHENASKHAINALGGNTILGSITRAHMGQIKKHLADKGRSPATIAKTIRTLRAMFYRAVQDGLIVDNPFARPKLGKVQPKAKRIYSPKEIACMVEVTPDPWWKAFITLAVTSGLRKAEMLHLQWRDIDFDAGTVTVSAKRTGTFRLGDADYPILEWSSKSSRERTIPLPPDMLVMLGRFKMKGDGSPYVFLTLDRLAALETRLNNGQLPASINIVNNVNRHFDQIQVDARALLAKRCGLRLDKVEWQIGTIHDLRKTYATTMAQHVPMNDLRDLLGHESISTTADYYTAATDTVAKAVRIAFASAS